MLTTLVVTGAQHLALKAAQKAAMQYFKVQVIERWSTHRSEKFIAAFLEEVRKESDTAFDSANLNDMLRQVSAGEKQSAALFEAYRRVALSASKDIGPMIIGLLTAAIVLEDRHATNDEELVLQAAEILNDRDFDNFEKWMSNETNATVDGNGGMRIFIKKGPEQPPGVSLGRVGSGLDDVPLNIVNEVGIFALKLKNIGLLTEIKVPRENPALAGATQFFVVVSEAGKHLYRLAIRARSVPG